jgi:hypothetical protein
MQSKNHFKIITLSLAVMVFTLSSFTVLSQSRDNRIKEINELWQSVVRAWADNMPATAITQAKKLYNLANETDSYQYMVLSADAIIKNTERSNWKERGPIIKEFIQKTDDFKEPVARAIYISSLLQHLKSYQNYSLFENSESVSDNKLIFIEKILPLIEELKREERSNWFCLIGSQPFMNKYTNLSVYEYTLINILLSLHEGDYIEYSQFHSKNLLNIEKFNKFNGLRDYLFNELLFFQKSNINNYLISKLFQYRSTSPYTGSELTEEKREQEYQILIEKHKNYRNVTLFVNELAKITEKRLSADNRSDGSNVSDSISFKYRELYGYCDYWIKKHSNGLGIPELVSLQERILSKSIYTIHPNQLYPGKSFNLKILHRNISRGDISIYKIGNLSSPLAAANFVRREKELDSTLNRDATLILKAGLNLNNKRFAVYNTDYYPLLLPDEGIYIIKIDGEDGKLSYISRVFISKSAALHRLINNNFSFYLADFESGKPLENGSITIAEEVNNWLAFSPDSIKVLKRYDLILNGFTPVDIRNDINTKRALFYKTGEYGPYSNLYSYYFMYREVKQPENYIEIFSDRKLYKPGDTLFFKTISYNNDPNKLRVNSNNKIRVTLMNEKGETVESKELTTNDFGSASGFFYLAQSGGNGKYFIDGSDTSNILMGRHSFRVEDYKRDSYYITTQDLEGEYKFGDSVIIYGNINSYSGFPMSNVKISYTIGVGVHVDQNWRNVYFGSVTKSETISDSMGNFQIPLFFTLDPFYNRYNTRKAVYEIQITGSSLSSESLIHTKTIVVGEEPFNINTNAERIICAQQNHSFRVDAHNNSREKIYLNGDYKIVSTNKEEPEIKLSGEIKTWEEIIPDFSNIKSGRYSFKSTIYGNRGEVIRDTFNFTLFHLNDTVVPVDSDYLFYPFGDKDSSNKIQFILGTKAERLYSQMEIIDNDSVIYRSPLLIESGMRYFCFDIPETNSKEVYLSVNSILKGKTYSDTQKYTIFSNEIKPLQLHVSNLKKSYLPSANETITVKLRDHNNNPVTSAELMVSIYDKANDKWGQNSFNLLAYKRIRYPEWYIQNSASFRGNSGFFIGTSNMLDNELAFAVSNTPSSLNENTVMRYNADIESNKARVDLRRNFNERLAFKPHLYPDKSGNVKIEFNTSHLLSTFNLLLMAHDKELKNGSLREEFIVNKDLMIQSNLPKFIREGDTLIIESIAINLSKEALKTTCEAYTGDMGERKIGSYVITLEPGDQKKIEWKIFVPQKSRPGSTVPDSLKLRIMLISDKYSDGEEHIIKVVPAWRDIATAKVHPLEKAGNYKFSINPVVDPQSIDLKGVELRVSSPVDILSKELEMMKNPESKDLFSLLSALYAKGYFKDPGYETFREMAFTQFENLTDNYGFYCWFPGMNGIYYLSYLFLEKINEIQKIAGFTYNDQEKRLLLKNIETIDTHFLYQHKLHIERKEKYPTASTPLLFAIYIRVRSLYPQFEMSASLKDAITTSLNDFEKERVRGAVMENAYIASALSVYGRDEAVSKYLKSIREYAIKNCTTGYYFPNAVLPFRGMVSNEISSHSFLLNLFADFGDKEMVSGIARWILLQKENQYWGSGLYLTDAVTALMRASGSPGAAPVERSKFVTKYRVDNKRGIVTVNKRSNDPEFLYIQHNYIKRDIDIKSFANGLSVESSFYRVVVKNGQEGLEEIKEGVKVNPGDIIEVVSLIQNSENRSYVSLISDTPASFVPIEERSGYRGFYYREVRRSSLNYYFNLLAEGQHIIRERFIVNNRGSFSTGIPVIKSLFAPAYQGNGTTTRL